MAQLTITGAPLGAAEKAKEQFPLLKINKELDKRTEIKKSQIPKGGNGLYARVPIKKGEVIGELGGRLLPADNYPEGNHYIAALLECAHKQAHPYVYLDAKDNGANVSRINFAPKKINGVDTNFQNAAIRRLCQPPYFEFYALRDIRAGEEIWSSYGPNYDYDRFMHAPDVKDFFCRRAKLDCRTKYSYEH
ncbi:MAG TPA: SET domain-containing protein [Candidatus Binatia bacterium]|nr:SET domain-containing protein [Candidatus Binatia bacterium]